MKRYILCGGGKPCCPEAIVYENDVVINDDYGGTVKMTREQFEILRNIEKE